jgi:Uma2 family endonuclease
MSTAVAPPKPEITPDELLSMPDGKRYELVDGKLVERNVGWDSSWIAGRLHHLLSTFCDSHGGGWVAPSDASYQCFFDEPKKVRRPDVSFIRTERLPASNRPQGHCSIAPDLAVEVISPRDLYSRVEAKVDEYLQAGTPLVWVVDPPTRTARVHRADGTVTDIHENGELEGEDVLPGFRCRLADVFRTPSQK